MVPTVPAANWSAATAFGLLMVNEYYVATVRPGRILFEVGGVTREEAQTALRLAAAKLPIRTKFVDRLETV